MYYDFDDDYNAYRCYNTFKNHLCSVLMHRIGPPLLFYLNNMNSNFDNDDEKQQQQLSLLEDIAQTFLPNFDPYIFQEYIYNTNLKKQQYDSVFQNVITTVYSNNCSKLDDHTLLTLTLYEHLKQLKVQQKSWRVHLESITTTDDDTEEDCCSDLLIICDDDESIITMFEVGFQGQQKNSWWNKMRQNITKYTDCTFSNNKFQLDNNKPIQLVTITIDNEVLENGMFHAKFGVFLCTKKKEKYRMALLWRTKTTTLTDASKAFARILYATDLCTKWRFTM